MDARNERRWLRSATVIGTSIGALALSAAFASWLANGEGPGQAEAGTAQELVVTGAVAGQELYPGTSGDVGLTITNPNPYPVLVTLVEQVPDSSITSDTVGCDPSNHEVTFTTQNTAIPVPANDATTANLVDAVAMGLGTADACQGAVFTIQLRVSGAVDDGSGLSTFFLDADGDGFGDPDSTIDAASPPEGYVTDSTDCDDTDPSINPAATEVANGTDDDCDGLSDEGIFTFFLDADGDGFGDPDSTIDAASPPEGYVGDGSDCDDTDASINPAAPELLNGVDDDCDGILDEDFVTTFFLDADGDGFGDFAISTEAVSPPEGYVTDSSDCDDSDPSINPAATEVANGTDDDCDGIIDEDFPDFDADGLVDELDPDDDNDGVLDEHDANPLDPFVCSDVDLDGGDDCTSGTFDPFNDGLDSDGDGIIDTADADPFDPAIQ